MSSTVPAHDRLLLDLDGTVYHGPRVIPAAAEAVRAGRDQGSGLRFVTNNASRSPAEVAAHLCELGVPAEESEVCTSAQAAANLLGARLDGGAEVLVVGTESLAAEVCGAGLKPVRQAADGVAAVVQGHSPDTSWRDLAEACVLVRDGALWVACNVDPTLPTERGQLPGNGSMVAALRTATGTEPVVAGKPSRPLLDTAADGADRPLVVGDRLDTDIAGAVAAGMDSLLVLTGVATAADLLRAGPDERPRYLAADLGALSAPVGELEIGSRPGWTVRPSGDVLEVSGSGDALELLRALCGPAWESGTTRVHATEPGADAALRELGLG